MLMLKGYGFLDLIKFGSDPRIVLIAVRVKSCEGLEAFVWAVVINEPTGIEKVSFKIGN